MRAVALGGAACAATALMAYAVRGRSSSLLAPSVYRGPSSRRAIALTFDDGPTESTPRLLDLLEDLPATFFVCGQNVERRPEILRSTAEAGHEIGNHTYSHQPLYFRSPERIFCELDAAQSAIGAAAGVRPTLFRAPFGARWFGLREAQSRLGLVGVMWTILGLDWKRSAEEIVRRVLGRVHNGAIICLHDGRGVEGNPDIRPTLDAVARLIPALRDRGYEFRTVSQLLCPSN
jgi:peptidoglycan-N-acetylglucosamine deacetylase